MLRHTQHTHSPVAVLAAVEASAGTWITRGGTSGHLNHQLGTVHLCSIKGSDRILGISRVIEVNEGVSLLHVNITNAAMLAEQVLKVLAAGAGCQLPDVHSAVHHSVCLGCVNVFLEKARFLH
eukprot:GFYU01027129.1.p1 GENE.GFYU01027129.1~~GFYU01027129.1.p1  ORF type:complete len:123 (+),score=7.24 GFYU01027129.1:1-369(+)